MFDENSRLLILGSFPSVQSHAVGFFYGNPRNAFWRTLCTFFDESVPASVQAKRDFLLSRRIALWDVVAACDIVGSKDASISDARIADLDFLIERAKIERIFANGAAAYGLLAKHFPHLLPIALKLPSTSPANPRFSQKVWFEALKGVFDDL